MKNLILLLAGAGALSALAAVEETIANRVVTLSGTGSWIQNYLAADVDSVEFASGANVTWTPAAVSTYTGGTIFKGSLLYLGANGALGTGDLDMQSGALSVASGADVTVANKVIFNQNNTYGYACAMDGNGSLTLQSVGTPASGSTHHIRLGRASAASAGTATLSLTQANSEALDQIILAGKVDVTLKGGTVKARSDAKSPFFSKAWSNSSPTVTVATEGVTFDLPADTAVTLGETLAVEQSTRERVAETFYPENWSFESGSTGWTLTRDEVCGEWSEIAENGAPYDGNGKYPTTNGTHYAMIRRGNKLQQTIQVPTAGKWRVVLERGCRDGNYSKYLGSWVKVGDTQVMEMPELSEPEGFTQYTSDLIELAVNQDYLLSIEVEAVTAGNTSFNFDAIRLERVVNESIRVPFIKSGLGTLNTGAMVMSNTAITVSAGTLKSAPHSLAGSTVAVADGATFALDGATLGAVTSVTVAAGGTLKLSGTMDNLLKNASFEAGYTANYDSASAVAEWELSGPYKGISANGQTTFGANLESSGCGDQVLFLREGSTATQTVTVPLSGEYEISFLHAPRQYLSPHTVPIKVKIDDEVVMTVPARASRVATYVRYSETVTLSAGEHTFVLLAESTDNTYDLMFDDVALRPVAETTIGGTLALASGSTLVLNNAKPIRWTSVTVDGVAVNGGKATLKAAGVTVQGDGMLQIGEPRGLYLILR